MRRNILRTLEAALVSLLFIQALRHVYAALYADFSSADLVGRISDPARLAFLQTQPGYIEPATLRTEILAILLVFLTPLLALLIGHIRWSLPLAVSAVVLARYLSLVVDESSVFAATVVIGGGLLYLTILMMRRPRYFPVFMATGAAGDQLWRAWHQTTDPSFDPNYRLEIGTGAWPLAEVFFVLAILGLLLTALTTIVEREESRLPSYQKQAPGVLTLWGSLALGGMLFLQLSLLGLPNAAARWATWDYPLILPLMLLATMLPLVPEVRAQASNFLSIFDGLYRGWLWTLLLVLFLIMSRRFEGPAAGLMLALAQFFCILSAWWLLRQPDPSPRPNPTPFWALFSVGVFLLLSVGDYFSYDYAYVRPIAAPFAFIGDALAGMRGLGLPIALLAVVFVCLPMVLERQIIPWRSGKLSETLLSLMVVVSLTLGASTAAAPVPLRRPLNPECLRVVTYNIHGGYTQLFAPNLEAVAQSLERSGADVILLQEVEAGLLRSGSHDQAYWLAQRLNMRAEFYPLNERLQGLAILSRLDSRQATGALLSSTAAQAGVQYVTYALDEGGDLHLYNVWLGFRLRGEDGQALPEGLQDQNIQQAEVTRLLAANHFGADEAGLDRVILGGTFNYDEDSPLYADLASTILRDPFEGLFAENRETLFLVDGRGARYDYLWLLNLLPSGVAIDQNNLASDHRPAIVEVGRQSDRPCGG
jgi:endonuclease/exonuclease/phosphatase family metal-dependent hydrolase